MRYTTFSADVCFHWFNQLKSEKESMHSLTWFLCGSGEKAETSEWPAMVEVKGRVRLSGFGKFIQELPKSRSRAVMVYKAFFCYHCSSIIFNLHLASNNNRSKPFTSYTYMFPSLSLCLISKTLLSSLHGNQKAKEITIKLFTCLCLTGMRHVLSRKPAI